MSHPKIAYPEMQKSSLVLFDMAVFYLPLYGRACENFFEFYPVLALVEGLIYQVEIDLDHGEVINWEGQKEVILHFLQEHDMVDTNVEKYLNEIGDYFASVKQLMLQEHPTHEEIVKTAELRPSDIRLLHLLLVKLLWQPLDKELFALLWPMENLLDLKANITEYAIDVSSGHYNTYQMFVNKYKQNAAHHFQTEQSRYQDMFDRCFKGASEKNRARVQSMLFKHERAYPSIPLPSPVI